MSIGLGRAKTNQNGDRTKSIKPLRPGPRGWLGRGRGEDVMVEAPDEYRGTTRQVCGLWPWIVGSGTPMVGVPLGRHIKTGATLCCDPISWYQRGGLISQPSQFWLAEPGLGKTTGVMRTCIGSAGYGVIPLVLGDTRPDYSRMIEALGGEVIPIGRNRGSINLLDRGEAPEAAQRLREADRDDLAEEVLADSHGLRLNMLISAFTVLHRGAREITPTERNVLSRALTWLDDNFEGVPLIGDLLTVIRDAPQALEYAALSRGDEGRYQDATDGLVSFLMAMDEGGAFGSIFARHTTHPMRRDRPMSYDLSAIPSSEDDLRALALLACWTAGFASVGISQVLADAEIEPRRHYLCVLDELHQALKAGKGLVNRVDYLTRLNRTEGVGLIMITHTLKDLESLPDEADRQKAMGFIERSAIKVAGGLPMAEMPKLSKVVGLSAKEQHLLASWGDAAPYDSRTGKKGTPPGRGKFLVKVGTRPGIPIQTFVTSAELALSMSDDRWASQSQHGALNRGRADQS